MIRADTGYFNGDFLDECDAQNDGYLIKVKLKNLTSLLVGQTWTKIDGQAGWEQASFEYQCGTWGKSRPFLAVRRKKSPLQLRILYLKFQSTIISVM